MPRRAGRRIGGRTVALAFVVLALAVVALATVGVRVLARNEQSLANTIASEASRTYGLTHDPASLAALNRDGVRVIVHGMRDRADLPVHRALSAPPLPPRGLRPPVLSMLAGLHPVPVSAPDLAIVVVPDDGRFASAAVPIAGGAVALVATIAVVLLLALAFVNCEAARPLHETTAALRRLAQRDFTPQLIVADDRSPIGELARAYNEASRAVATAFDERRLAEAEMQRFVADAGHELRTPLTVMIGVVDILEQGTLDAALARRLFVSMRAESERMRATIEKLIALARLGAPESDEERETIDVGMIASLVVEELAPIAGDRQLTVRVRGPFPPTIEAAESEIHEAIFNCGENAVKYGARTVRILIDTREDAVQVAVEDDGRGMTTAEQRRAFERFYRGEETRGIPGSGLGLAIVKRIVEKLGGNVRLASSPGQGTRVVLTLPRRSKPR